MTLLILSIILKSYRTIQSWTLTSEGQNGRQIHISTYYTMRVTFTNLILSASWRKIISAQATRRIPVVPEVYKMYKGEFASTGWHGWGFDLFIMSSQSSWPSKRGLSQMFLLWNTMHRGFFTVIIFIASFNMSVYLRFK